MPNNLRKVVIPGCSYCYGKAKYVKFFLGARLSAAYPFCCKKCKRKESKAKLDKGTYHYICIYKWLSDNGFKT